MADSKTDLGFVPAAERLRRSHEGFLESTTDHALTVIRDDGVYRHLRVGRPGTGMWSWSVVTWPGHLAITGDVAEGYVFARVTDMLDFFRSGARDGRSIDFRYWAEKVVGRSRTDLKVFSEDAFLEAVHHDLFVEGQLSEEVEADVRADDPALADKMAALRQQVWDDAKEVSDPYGHDRGFYEWLAEYSVEVPEALRDFVYLRHGEEEWTPWADDYYEMGLQDWDSNFLIACWALALTVRLWDAHVAERGASDGFAIVEGGMVQNDPGSTPVYDLDCLHGQGVDPEEVDDLFWRMVRDPNRAAIRPHLERVLARLADTCPDPERVEEARAAFERQGRAE